MKKWFHTMMMACISLSMVGIAQAADVVPPEIMMPGTQPNEVGNFESPDKCDNCHAGYNDLDPGAEPATGWRGGAMGNAGRDAIFWATLAVAEQDFDGVGDLCIRCHSAKGWYGGRSTPTDGSGLASSDDNGIDCDTCHATTNPDNSGKSTDADGNVTDLVGVMIVPFTANCNGDPLAPDGTCESSDEGYYGSGMLSLYPDVNVKLGPFKDAEARHQWRQSDWHRDVDFCGSCHDVSNSAVGDLAQNHGTQLGAPDVVASGDGDCIDENGNNFNGVIDLANGKADLRSLGGGCLGSKVEDKAAFNNPPYAYGVVERTFSEYKASAFPTTRVGHFDDLLPADLQVAGGSLDVTYQAAIAADDGSGDGIEGDYADGTERFFSCQSCHMRPVGGSGYPGCNKNGAPVRPDLPRHDHTGGNYWFASITKYQDDAGTLRVGGGLNSTQLLAMDLGQERATKHLSEAGSLTVTGNTLKVTNLTGHKLITGYPEGRRMWLNIKWYDDAGTLLREDGEYGTLQTLMDIDGNGTPGEIGVDVVETILDLDDPYSEIYEAHYAITKDWAGVVEALHGPDFALSYDRETGDVVCTVSEFTLADNDPDKKPECAGEYHNTFHFALNNHVSNDNRIPPYGMRHTEAERRNALPVLPTEQSGRYGPVNGTYNHYDTVTLVPPSGATNAQIQLLYQGTSWEYNQFLLLANDGSNEFLGQEGVNMMDAWINAEVRNSQGAPITGVMEVNGDYKMVPPVVMATAQWGTPPVCVPTEDPEVSCNDGIDNDCDGFTDSADSDCDTPPVCTPTQGQETQETSCDDGIDNDCDELVDCDDSDCSADPACQTGMACSDYGDETTCTNNGCEWGGKGKNKSCKDPATPPPPSACDVLDQTACTDDPACRWSKKDGVCLTR